MRTKQIINQLNFQKVNKQQLFLVRSKPQAFRVHPSQYTNKSNKNIQNSDTAARNVDECLELLEMQIRQEKYMEKDICSKIKKYLLQFKAQYQSQEEDEAEGKYFGDQQQHPSPLVRKGSSKTFVRPRLEMTQESRSKENMWFGGESTTLQLRKVKTNKLKNYKENKENNEKQIKMLEDRIKQLSQKIQQFESSSEQLNNEINQLKAQLQEQTHEKSRLSLKLVVSYSQKKQSESFFNECVNQATAKWQQSQKKGSILMQQLLQRQGQIVNLWQMLDK